MNGERGQLRNALQLIIFCLEPEYIVFLVDKRVKQPWPIFPQNGV